MVARSDLTIHQFRVFDAVVRTGSLTQAALRLDTPQPSISRIIARLEREIGTLLLHRSSNGVALTAAGEQFHYNATNTLYYHDLAIEEARASQGLFVGEVRIAAPDSVAGILFAPLVKKLQRQHESVRLQAIASQSSEIPSLLSTGHIDIGIVANTHELPPGNHEPLFREELYLVGRKSAAALGNPSIPLAHAASLPLILNAMPGGFRGLIDAGFSQLGLSPTVAIEIDANNALLQLLDQGIGYSILPYSLVSSARSRKTLGASRLINPSLARTLFMITTTNRPVRSVVREVIRMVRSTAMEHASRGRWLDIDGD